MVPTRRTPWEPLRTTVPIVGNTVQGETTVSLHDEINAALQPANDAVLQFASWFWYIGLLMLVCAGIFFTCRFRGLQFTRIPEQVRLIFGRRGKGGKVSSFQAFCMGLGERVGIGNITGVSTAILLGGPGAIFWMWVFALIGGATSFVECTLGQIYKRRKEDGQFFGGPAYYICNGLKNRKLAVFMALWIILTYGVGMSANQTANASDAIASLVGWEYTHLVLLVLFVGMTAYLVFGGIPRIARTSGRVVPYMALAWLGLATVAVVTNLGLVDDVLRLIVADAFDFSKIAAGFAGSCLMWGLKRGVFSNEAGSGSIPNTSSCSDVRHPVDQGYLQSLGALIDTLVVCSATAFIILLAFPQGLSGLGLDADDCVTVVGESVSLLFGWDGMKVVLAVFMFVFAFTSLIAIYTISETNIRFVSDDPKAVRNVRLLTVAAVAMGGILPISLIWNLVDVFLAVMTVVNLYVILRLHRYVVSAHDDYRRQKDSGIDEPVFSRDTLERDGLDVSGIVCWETRR